MHKDEGFSTRAKKLERRGGRGREGGEGGRGDREARQGRGRAEVY